MTTWCDMIVTALEENHSLGAGGELGVGNFINTRPGLERECVLYVCVFSKIDGITGAGAGSPRTAHHDYVSKGGGRGG